MSLKHIIIGSCLLLSQLAFGQGKGWPDYDVVVPVASNEIKIMNYNVENLFDTEHDEGKTDWEYLPIKSPLKENCKSQGPYRRSCEETNWISSHLQAKLYQLRGVIMSQGSLPDILTLEEVENENIVKTMAKLLGYRYYVMTNSPDKRGIDVAILFNEGKIKYINYVERRLSDSHLKSRNLLGANFSLAGSREVLGVYVNHWPSQGKPSSARVGAAMDLRKLVDEVASYYPDNYHVVLAGDFNTIDQDKPHPFKEVIQDPKWDQRFFDAQDLFERLNLRGKVNMPLASYFYSRERTWNKLDRFFVNKTLVDGKGVEIVQEWFRVIAPKFALYEYKSKYFPDPFYVPLRSNHNGDSPTTAGYSDHFPVVMKIRL